MIKRSNTVIGHHRILLYLMNRAPFIDPTFKQIIFWIVLVCVVLWLLSVFGLLDSLYTVRTPHVRH
jgi:hypothetical protein